MKSSFLVLIVIGSVACLTISSCSGVSKRPSYYRYAANRNLSVPGDTQAWKIRQSDTGTSVGFVREGGSDFSLLE